MFLRMNIEETASQDHSQPNDIQPVNNDEYFKEYIIDHPEKTQKELAIELDISQSKVSRLKALFSDE